LCAILSFLVAAFFPSSFFFLFFSHHEGREKEWKFVCRQMIHVKEGVVEVMKGCEEDF
jgi:hypothetical protein